MADKYEGKKGKMHWHPPHGSRSTTMCGLWLYADSKITGKTGEVTCLTCRKQIAQYENVAVGVQHYEPHAGEKMPAGPYYAHSAHWPCGRTKPRNAVLVQAAMTDKRSKVTCPGCRAQLGYDKPEIAALLAASPDFTLSRNKDGWYFGFAIPCKKGDEDRFAVLGDVLLAGGWARIARDGKES